MEFPIFFLASVVCIALFFLFRGIDNEKYEKFVRNYSVALKELQELNEKLTKTVAEPDVPDTEVDDEMDV